MRRIPLELETKWRKLLRIFRDEGLEQNYDELLTPTQIQIIDIIAKRRHPRTQLILPTQYGKSLSVALGVLLRISTHKEKWAIIAPTEDKARIIMDYIIDHIFDDPLFAEQLEYYGSKEKLKQERSKVRITFRDGGEVRVYTGNAQNTKATKKALMGFGAANVILDESALINDDLYATVKRMLGGSKDNFLLEIGNPFYRNHFHRTWFGERYMKVYKDVYEALEEGRYTQDYIEEMKEEAFFDVLYECLFPDADEVLPNGYRRLVTDTIIENAFIDNLPELEYETDTNGEVKRNDWGYKIVKDKPVLGIDVSGSGPNETRFIIRLPEHNVAFVAKVMKGNLSEEDLEEVADVAEDLAKEWNITDYRIAVDAGGVGYGLPAILRRRGLEVKAVMFGETTHPKTKKRIVPKNFLNHRAFLFWEARRWLRADNGKLVREPGFFEIKHIYYRRNARDKTQIEPKEDMIKRKAEEGEKVSSPDTADAFALTFVDTSTIVEEDDIYVD